MTLELPFSKNPSSSPSETDETVRGPQPFTVTQLTARVKNLLENEVGEVWVKGEISGYKPSPSGHLYFSLKDSGAVLSCAMFRGMASKNQSSRAKFQLQDGLEVLVHGKISVYPPRGNYQLIVDSLEPVGHGALQLAFEQLKAKLQAEGLFSAARKRPLPAYPSKIAIITSPTGAALQDMLNVLGRRNAGISIVVVPSLVQGEEAPAKLLQALKIVNKFNLGEVVILARGGGSIEDLWAFNNEALVREVAASAIPVISAIGHEVDFTLCDFAADLRAPTPSAAAELVSKNKLDVFETVTSHNRRLYMVLSHRIARLKSMLLASENRLISPAERLARLQKRLEELELRMAHSMESKWPFYRQMLDEFQSRMSNGVERKLALKRRQLEGLSSSLEALSPLKVLGRGYTLLQDPKTHSVLKSVKEATAGRKVSLVFHDGEAAAQIL